MRTAAIVSVCLWFPGCIWRISDEGPQPPLTGDTRGRPVGGDGTIVGDGASVRTSFTGTPFLGETNGTLADPAAMSVVLTHDQVWSFDPSWIDMTDLVGYWPLDESPMVEGTLIADNSPSGSHGGIVATGADGLDKSVPGKVGGAICFDGIEDRVTLTISPQMDRPLGHSLSFTGWFMRTGDLSHDMFMAVDYGPSSQSWHFEAQSNSVVNYWNDVHVADAQVELEAGEWNHIAMVVTDGIEAVVYFNGNAVQSGAITDIARVAISAAIGSSSWGRSLDGCIDEVSYWNRALSAEEVERIFLRQSPQQAGTYDGSVLDAGLDVTWTTLSWETERPSGKPVPDASESVYSAGNVDRTGLVGLWHLDAPRGTVLDGTSIPGSAQLGNHGAIADGGDGSVVSRRGRFGNGLFFDGLNDLVRVPNSSSLDITNNEITVAAWVLLPDNTSPEGHFVAKEGFNSGYRLGYNAARDFFLQLTGSAAGQVNADSALMPNRWRLYVGTYDGTTMQVWVDGVADSAGVARSGPIDSNASEVVIGHGNETVGQSTSYPFHGDIDEVAIWTRALDSREIMDLYLRGALRVSFRVRACDDPTCAGEAWIGPDGTADSFYSEQMNATAGYPILPLTNLRRSRYLQFRAYLESDTTTASPRLGEVRVDATP